MNSGKQVFRTLAIGVLSLAIVIVLTRLVTNLWALLAVTLALQALLIGDRVWRHLGRLLKQRQGANWDVEWDGAWAEQDARPIYLTARLGPAEQAMRASVQPLGIMDALSAAREILEQCQEWQIVSIQVNTHDRTYRRYRLTARHELTGTLRVIYTPQDCATFLREVRASGQMITQPQPGIARDGIPAAH